ncbi:MAG: NAD(P)/FAD-dependent oxidoreductase [Acidobacteriota bacterium]
MTLDVVVVGGGPAGSSVATELAGRGRSVLICDAARFPRHKVCGEYIPPAARPHFERLGAWPAIERIGPRRHIGMAVISPGGFKVLGRYDADACHGLALRRYDLDAVLLANATRAGVRVEEGARLTGIKRNGDDRFELTFHAEGDAVPWRVRCRALVGADGRNSLVARRLGLRRRERHRRWAIMGHFRAVRAPDDHGEMIVTDYGYCGINPLPGGLTNICIVIDAERDRMPGRRGLPRFFADRIAAHPLTRMRMIAAVQEGELRSIGPMACRTISSVADGALLVGDAAGFFDPFTGEGIAMALRGAEMAAGVLDEALQRGDLSARSLGGYEHMRRSAFSGRLRIDRLLQSLLPRPRLTDWVARKLVRDPSLADLLARVTGDTAAPAEVLSARFLARFLRA